MTTFERLGDRLKQAFQHRGLSQKRAQERLAAAKVPGASHANLYKIFAGETSPSVDLVVGVSEVLGVSAGWLLTGEGEIETREPFPPEEVENYGLQDLPEPIQHDVLDLAERLYLGTDRTGLNLGDSFERIAVLSRGIAAWLRIPLHHSDKFRRLDRDLEMTAFCDVALRALRMLVPEGQEGPRPGGVDGALVELTALERELAGRGKPSALKPRKPEIAATVGVRTDA